MTRQSNTKSSLIKPAYQTLEQEELDKAMRKLDQELEKIEKQLKKNKLKTMDTIA